MNNEFLNDLWINLQSYYDSFIILLPKLVLAIISFYILLFIANKSRNLANHRLTERMDDPLLAAFLSRIIKIIIVIFALMVVMNIIGLAGVAGGLLTGASVSAVVIGFAFKDIGENFLAGIILAFNRPFRVGDTVELDGIKGKVVALNIRNTQIKSFDGKDIFIPNANVIKNPVFNYTLDGFMRHEFNIGLDYGSDTDKAISILQDTIGSIGGVLQGDRGPSVQVGDLNSSSYNLTVQYWLNTFDKNYPANSVRTKAINEAMTQLEDAGFYMPGDIVELKNYNDREIKTGISEKKPAV